MLESVVFFFFQAEDGIRDLYVTGVQTCALPIWTRSESRMRSSPVSERFAASISGIPVLVQASPGSAVSSESGRIAIASRAPTGAAAEPTREVAEAAGRCAR